MAHQFYGRTRELDKLDRVFARKQGGQLFVLYGRRRVGKTELINHWLRARKHRHILWTADRTSNSSSLRTLSQKIYAFENPTIEIAPNFSYQSWEQAFAQLATISKTQRLVVVLDEFTYAMEAEKALPSILQRLWDHHLKNSRIMLILTGSHAGMIEREILAYRSPLYGRATDSEHLQPLPFGAMSQFLPNYSAENRILMYGCVGGIPLYLEGLEPDATLEENLALLLTRNVMLDDAGALLRDQLSEPRNYVAITESIAAGFTRLTEIAKMAGMDDGATSKYLSVMQKLGIVERQVPATVSRPAQSKLGRYRITDPYLRFYYRFIAPHRSLIESGRLEMPLAHLKQHLPSFVGKHAFEELCREWILDRANDGTLGFVPRRVGSYWGKKSGGGAGVEIDILAINEDEHELLLGECKFTQEPIGAGVVRALLQDKAARVELDREKAWKIRYAFFSRNGFTPEARGTLLRGQACEWVDLSTLDKALCAT